MSRGLAILATAAVTGTAFAAAVTLPTVVTLGSDSPPESLALPSSSSRPTAKVVHAAPLPAPNERKQKKRSRHAPARLSATADGQITLSSSGCSDTLLTHATSSGDQTGNSLTATVESDPCNRFNGKTVLTWVKVL